jgi:hypothetical protein
VRIELLADASEGGAREVCFNLVATPCEMYNWLFIYQDVNGGETGNETKNIPQMQVDLQAWLLCCLLSLVHLWRSWGVDLTHSVRYQ